MFGKADAQFAIELLEVCLDGARLALSLFLCSKGRYSRISRLGANTASTLAGNAHCGRWKVSERCL